MNCLCNGRRYLRVPRWDLDNSQNDYDGWVLDKVPCECTKGTSLPSKPAPSLSPPREYPRVCPGCSKPLSPAVVTSATAICTRTRFGETHKKTHSDPPAWQCLTSGCLYGPARRNSRWCDKEFISQPEGRA